MNDTTDGIHVRSGLSTRTASGRFVRFFSAIGVLTICTSVFFGCIHEVPEVHFYSIESPLSTNNMVQDRSMVCIAIQDFTSVAALEVKDLAYSPSRYQFGYYDYHQWVAPPAQLLRERFLNDPVLASSAVLLSGAGSDSDFNLRCNVKAFHESDTSNGCRAVVAVDVILEPTLHPKNVWEKAYYYEEAIGHRTPAAVVTALNTAVDRLMADLIPEIQNVIRNDSQ